MLSKKSLIWLIPSSFRRSKVGFDQPARKAASRVIGRRCDAYATAIHPRSIGGRNISLVELERSQDGRLPKFFGILPGYGR
jgi:hypothetical protein